MGVAPGVAAAPGAVGVAAAAAAFVLFASAALAAAAFFAEVWAFVATEVADDSSPLTSFVTSRGVGLVTIGRARSLVAGFGSPVTVPVARSM